MRNIKNLKDPTGGWRLWLALCLLHLATLASAALPNVSCIPHDTKFTCDCHNAEMAMLLPQLQGEVYQVEVRNCRALTVNAHALAGTEGLRKIHFRQVDQLVLNKYALSVSRYASNKALIVEFEQVNFELIDSHAINGNIEEISFVGGRIERIQPFGFTTTKDSAILLKLDGVTFQRIESQAFKKFAVEQMLIANCHFATSVPTRAFYELEVLNELTMSNNRFEQLHSHAFSFKLISKLSVSNNRFAAIEGEWLEGHIRDAVTLRGNDFGLTSDIAFRSLAVHRDYLRSERLELRFQNNTVRVQNSNSPAALPLRFDARFALSLQQLRYDNVWSCGELDRTVEPPLPKAEFFRLHNDQLYFRRELDGNGDGNGSFAPLRQLIFEQCQPRSYVGYIVLGSVLLGLILLLLLLFVWCRLSQRRRRRKMDVVQPEPRTYKETQIIYQIENAGLLKTDL